jgi:hypothetical protein
VPVGSRQRLHHKSTESPRRVTAAIPRAPLPAYHCSSRSAEGRRSERGRPVARAPPRMRCRCALEPPDRKTPCGRPPLGVAVGGRSLTSPQRIALSSRTMAALLAPPDHRAAGIAVGAALREAIHLWWSALPAALPAWASTALAFASMEQLGQRWGALGARTVPARGAGSAHARPDDQRRRDAGTKTALPCGPFRGVLASYSDLAPNGRRGLTTGKRE